jgi:PAS domain S-box-containing protein
MASASVLSLEQLASLPPDRDDFATLYQLTDRLYRSRNLQDVFDAALDVICDALGCARASILLFDGEGVMRFAAWRGLSEGYRTAVSGHSPWQKDQRGAEPILVEDIRCTDEPDWIKETIVQENVLGLAFIPLVVEGGVVGKFMTYYEAPHVFSRREIELAITISRQVGFSIEKIRADEARQLAEDGLRQSEERSRLMVENAPVMIWMSDRWGRCLQLNRRLREFWGVEESAIATFDWSSTMHPDDAHAIGSAMADALKRHAPVMTHGRFRDVRGNWRIIATDAQPRFSQAGQFLGMIGVNVDVTEREEAERAIRTSAERFRLVFEAAPSGMVIIDGAGIIQMINAQAERLFGYDRDELLGKPVELLIPEPSRGAHAIRRPGSVACRAKAPREDRTVHGLRKDGTTFPAEIGLSPVGEEGDLCLAAVVDVSERHQAEMQREVLIAELNHRVKNTLAVVQGLAHQTFKGEETSPHARTAFEGRLHALAVAHNMLTRTNWSQARLDELAEDALGLRLAHRDRIVLDGPVLMLEPKAALAVAMALHELQTNAVKYGALSNDTGTVRVTWRVCETGRFRLDWMERGGPPVRVPAKQGFGSRLIQRILASDLEGRVQLAFQPEGVTCAIEGVLVSPASIGS